MAAFRFSLMLLVTASVWLAPSVASGRPIEGRAAPECIIMRPDGFKEPGMKNVKGECCSSFYADDCVRPTSGQQNGVTFYGSAR
jgi:hypothetical protein